MKKRVFVRKLPAIIAAAGLMVSLSACAAAPSPFGACTGSSAALVASDGTFPTPLIASTPEAAVVSAEDGAQVLDSDAVVIDLVILDATTGETLQEPLTLPTFVNGLYPFTSAASCTTVGSQVAILGTASDLINPTQPSDQQIVILATVSQAFPAQATGTDQVTQSGFPGVVFTPIGQPGFTFPDGAAPTELKISTLKQGSGATVKQGNTVFANVSTIAWGATQVLKSSWDNLAPDSLVASPLATDDSGVVPGLATALIGEKVGSRVMVVVPPADGYPPTQLPEGIAPTDTLVFVVDILAIG